MNATPEAFNMISTDINIKMRFRRTRSPISPNANNTPASNMPWVSGIDRDTALTSGILAVQMSSQMIGADQPWQQEHGGQLDPDQVRTKQHDAHLFGSLNRDAAGLTQDSGAEQIEQFPEEGRRQDRRPDPHSRCEPARFLLDRPMSEIQHHDHEDEQD